MMSNFIKQYYGENELQTEQYIQLNNELNNIHSENDFIIAAMRSPDTADNLRKYIDKHKQLPFKYRFSCDKILRYLYKIKKIIEACG